MNEIITVNYDNEQPTVSAREMHDFLEVGADFRHWFPRMCEYGLSKGVISTRSNLTAISIRGKP